MIKGMTLVTPVASMAALDRLASLLAALGFEPGKGWQDGTGRGEAFLAPLGNLELVAGRLPAVPPILIEVTQLDQVRATVEQWMVAGYRTEEVAELLSPVAPTHWNSRLFKVALDPSLIIGFWESENPLAGRPIAIEGDHPRLRSLCELISLRGVPSGLDRSNLNSPLNPTTDATSFARSTMLISSPDPTLTCPSSE